MSSPATNQFYLVLENYDSVNPPKSIMITSGSPASFVSPFWWKVDTTTALISKQLATSGTPISNYFVKWSDLPDYPGASSLISGQSGATPLSRKYIIIPDVDITAARVYISKSTPNTTDPTWTSWKVTSKGDIPAFGDDIARLSSDTIVDKAEFTYLSRSLTINTTTVDFLSIPMTVESIFNVAAVWGNHRGPMGISSSLSSVSKNFSTLGTKAGVNWDNLVNKNGSSVSRILSPFRYINSSPSDISSWSSYFDDYLDGLNTIFSTVTIQYPMLNTFHAQGYYIGKISVNAGKWIVDACDQQGNVIKSDFFSIDPSSFKGNSIDIFAVTESNIGARDILAGINRGIAHINDNINSWAAIFGSFFPSSSANPTQGKWTASDWSNSQSYYKDGSFSAGKAIVYNQYSALLHQASIVGSASNGTAAPFPPAINKQQFCYGFSIDDVWAHGSAVYGQGVDGSGNSTTVSATISIFSQD